MSEATEFDVQSVLDASAAKAESLLGNHTEVDAILSQVKTQVADLPATVGTALSNIPLLASMIKGYITQEYTNVSPKVVASVLGALLYVAKGKDLIPDSIPILGLVDDVAVVALAMKLNEAEIEEFKQWQEDHPQTLDSATTTA